MRKIAGVFIAMLISVPHTSFTNPNHLQQLLSEYPYGLIGNDYGLLTREDLAINTCDAEKITPFSGAQNMAYPYWQCFPTKIVKVDCSSNGYDSVTNKVTAYFELSAPTKSDRQYYLARDTMSISDCQKYLGYWNQKTHGEQYVCISGTYGAFDEIFSGEKETGWVFNKFKTLKGCVANRSDCFLGRHPNKNCLLPKGWAAKRKPFESSQQL